MIKNSYRRKDVKKKLCAVMVFVLTAVMASGCVKKEEIQKYSHVDYAMGTVTNTTSNVMG